MGSAACGGVAVVAAAMVCTLSVAGCTADPDDQPTAVTPASPTPTDEQTEPGGNQVTEPTLPGAAEGSSIRSAKAFVGYYIDLLNYAMVTGDTKSFRAAARNCEGCDRYADLFDRTYGAGGSATTSGWKVTSSVATDVDSGTAVLADVSAGPITIQKTEDAEPKTFAADAYELRFKLGTRDDSWVVMSFAGS